MTESTESSEPTESGDGYEAAVALVGMAGRFPGAGSPEELWRNLQEGRPGLRVLTEDELRAAGVPAELIADPAYVRVGGPVDGIDQFDAGMFGFSPREAETMSPQHRLFLECSWEALERAGYPPVDPPGRVGVFGGTGYPDYLAHNVGHLAEEPGGSMLLAVGNERDSLAPLVAYKLGLRGPSIPVQTFCSTSLVAVHLACQSLLTFESDLALAGGAFLPLPQPAGYRYEPGGILSPNGAVRSFDAAADGTVMGAGVGVVALKRLADAVADGDEIHAVILGSAVNNDGRGRVGFTAPGVDGQAEVIATAIEVAGVKAESIGYVECHATGTALGDSIELAAMARALGDRTGPCVLGTLKPSLGHLDRASGVTALIRAAMQVREGMLPAIPNHQTPNPALAATEGRLKVLTEPEPWPAGDGPRRAGVSSFGLGGTNAHVVLEQAPPRRPRAAPYQGPHLLTLSAANPAALDEATERLAAHVAEHPEQDLADVAFTLQVSRGHFARRRAVLCTDPADAVAALRDPDRWIDAETTRRDPAVSILLDRPDPDGVVHNVLQELGVRFAGPGAKDAVEIAVPASGADEAPLAATARCWLAGCAIDWAALHHGCGRRVQLPTYPFQRRRFWVEPRPRAAAQPTEGRIADAARWTYLPSWRPAPLPIEDLDERLRAAGPWLVLAGDAVGEAISTRLARAGAEVVTARPGERFAQDESDDGAFTVRPESREDLDELLRAVFVAPRTIVHGFSLHAPAAGPNTSTYDQFDAAQDYGLRSAAALVHALAEDPEVPPTDLILLTSGAVALPGAAPGRPEHGGLAALGPSIAQENPWLACRHVDVAGATDGPGPAADVDQALAAMVHPHEGPVAVRGGEAFAGTYTEHAIPDPATPRFKAGEVVLITGGLGDVGLVLARHLASAHGVRLVLTARTPIPPRAEWPEDAGGPDRAYRHIRTIRALEAEGIEVLAQSVDVADPAGMRALVQAARDRFGRIDAVIHAAGVQNPAFFNLAHLTDEESLSAHLRAKVGGFLVLQDVLGAEAAGRRMAFSSLSSVLGGVALGAYAAANAALEAYALAARAAGHGQWTSVAWDTWRVDQQRLDLHHDAAIRDFGMAPEEGSALFERAFGPSAPARTIVSTGPLQPRIEQWVTGTGKEQAEPTGGGERHPRPDLPTPYVEPEPGTEAAVAAVWAETLGLERVGANDDFFELGGHSLLAITLATGIRKAVPAAAGIAPTALVVDPTVRALVARITAGG